MARSRLAKLLAVGLTASLAGIIVCAGAASAASQSKGYGQMKAGDVWYGNYKTGTERGYCGDPIAGGANLYAPTANGGTTYGGITATSSWNPKTTGVGALSAANVRRLAYVLSVHGQTNSNSAAAHVSYAVRTFVASPGGARGSAVPYAGDIKTGGVKLVDKAKKYAGPYAITPKLVTADKQIATLTGYRPISATGATMTGHAGTLTVTGRGVFDSNNETTMAAPADGRAVTIRATGDGTVTVKAAYDKLPATGLYYRKPANDKYQRILISGRTAPLWGTATTTVDVLNQPKVTTKTSDQVATAGSELTDTLDVSDLAPGSTVTVTSTLYGPFTSRPAESPKPPAGAAVAGTASTEVMAGPDGTTTAVTQPITIETSGYYVWFETTAATPENAAWPGQFGQATETTLVKWTPIVTTETSQQRATPGAKLTDTLTVTGLPPRTQVEVTSTLYGPFTTRPSESATVPDEAPVVGTITTPVTADEHGKATATTEALLTVEKRGYYVWHETIPAGNEHEAWPGRFSQTSETTIVPWQPAVTTQTSDQTAAPGAKITDTLTVSDLQPGATVQIITTLYGPFTDKPVPADEPPADATSVGTLTLEVTADADGNATAITKPLTVKGPGFYVWRERIAATDEHEAWAGRFGVESETTHVVAPPTPATPPVPPAPPVPPTPDVPHLPDTGAGATLGMIALAAGLIAAGGTLVGFGIRRLRHDTIQPSEWTPGNPLVV